VSITHANLAANIRCVMETGLRIRPEEDVGVSWLPLYHDMGLIGFVLAPVMHQVSIVFLPPLLFLKRPASWLQAITRHKGTIAYAPNFAYALSIRDKDLEGIDLSSWRVAGCGAEPIRPETLESFVDAFGKVGFKKEAMLPSYGMAEATLAIAFTPVGQGMKTLTVDGPKLWGEGLVKVARDDEDESVRLVSCGSKFPDHDVAIFDIEDVSSEKRLEDGHVGEIRIAGPSVMAGYWEDVERTREAFAGPFLRTGDLGFLWEGNVYICGRSKEVVIVNGRNYYPQDMEWEASKVAGVRKGNVIAFGARDPSGIERDRERVVVAFEMQYSDEAERAHAIAQVVPVATGALPKTSSGKLQRTKTRELYEAGELAGRPGRGDKADGGRVELVKNAALSQLSYLKLAVLGGRRQKKQ
jgi:fatty-acyl-CoA synthase